MHQRRVDSVGAQIHFRQPDMTLGHIGSHPDHKRQAFFGLCERIAIQKQVGQPLVGGHVFRHLTDHAAKCPLRKFQVAIFQCRKSGVVVPSRTQIIDGHGMIVADAGQAAIAVRFIKNSQFSVSIRIGRLSGRRIRERLNAHRQSGIQPLRIRESWWRGRGRLQAYRNAGSQDQKTGQNRAEGDEESSGRGVPLSLGRPSISHVLLSILSTTHRF